MPLTILKYDATAALYSIQHLILNIYLLYNNIIIHAYIIVYYILING